MVLGGKDIGLDGSWVTHS